MQIVPITPADLPTFQILCRQTFIDTYAWANTPENMQWYLETSFATDKISQELHDPNHLFYWAKMEDEAIGYVKLNLGQGQTELQDERSLEIERIYVSKNHQGKKIGNALLQKAIEVAQQRQLAYIWLGVWEQNPKAIEFYEKNGFVAFDKHIFQLGDEAQTDIMMRLEVG